MHRKATIIAISALAMTVLSGPVDAGIFGAGLGGALRGAMVGSLIGGRDGAGTGAVIGGLIGAGEQASRNRRQREMQVQAERRKAEWAAREQAERQQIRQQQAQAAPRELAGQTIVIETQKSLIRLGYDAGELGQAGPALTNAVIGYQRSKGLLETGELSQALLTHMLRNGG